MPVSHDRIWNVFLSWNPCIVYFSAEFEKLPVYGCGSYVGFGSFRFVKVEGNKLLLEAVEELHYFPT